MVNEPTVFGNSMADKLEEAIINQLPSGQIKTAEDFPVEHYFAPGLYARSLFRPAGTFIIGHAHKHAHLSIVLHGRLRVLMNGRVKEIVGPSKPFLSEAGVRKATYAVEDTTLITFHPTKATAETPLIDLEDELITKSEAFLTFEEQREMKRLRETNLIT